VRRTITLFFSIITAITLDWTVLACMLPPPGRPTPSGEISAHDAAARLRGYLRSYDPYDVPGDCLEVRTDGYDDAGYSFEVMNICAARPVVVGRWRVKTVTREILRQRDDGTYRRP
jgi:hypothetical protein